MKRLRGFLAAEQLAARRSGFLLVNYARQLEGEGAGDSIECRRAWLGVVLCDLRAALWGYRGRSQYDLFGPIGRHRHHDDATP